MLRKLNLSNNRLAAIPNTLSRLSMLWNLNVSNNQLTAIPDSLAEILGMRILDLSKNEIMYLPDSLGQLSSLEYLDVSSNQLTAIPSSLSALGRLRIFHIGSNPLPEVLVAALTSGLQSFFRYLKSIARRSVRPRTVKLVLLGEPQSGKTTLLEALRGNLHPCGDSRKETIGVNVVTIAKAHPTDKQPMYLSAWDFAGQHIEYATHQFFLTENAIYLILWNARQGTESGKRDLWYWLELLKMRVREPKFLLVATHTEHIPQT